MQFQKELNSLLTSQTRFSPYGQMLLAGLATYTIWHLPELHWGFHYLAVIAALNLVRIILTHVHSHISDKNETYWYLGFYVTTVATGILWGLQCAQILHQTGLNEASSIILLTIVAGLGAGSTVTLSSHKSLAVAFVFGLLSPVIYTLIFATNPAQPILAAVTIANFFFLLGQINTHGKLVISLKSRQDQLRAFGEVAMEGIIIHDQGRVLEVNPGFETMFQYKAQEIIGKDIRIITPPEDHEKNSQHGYKESAVPTPFRALRKDGSIFHAESVGRWFYYEGKRVRVACIQDATHRHQVETAIREREKAALESAQVKTQFLANMSHEIRTPLNAIIGITDILNEGQKTEQQNQYFRTLKSSSENLLVLINDILDFSKIDAGKIELENINFNLTSVIESQVNILAGRAKQQGIDLHVTIDPELPIEVKGDYGRLGQVILNLVNNAIKFTTHGNVKVTLKSVKQDNINVRVRCEVQDTGSGINPENAKKLFKPFTQADTSMARKHGGTGLGLSISRKLLELMGGEIGFQSEVGRGTTFWFEVEFPIVEAKSISESFLRRDWSRCRIGLVSSDSVITGTVSYYLKSWNMPCVHVTPDSIKLNETDVIIAAGKSNLEEIQKVLKSHDGKKIKIISIENDIQSNPTLSDHVVSLPIRYSDLFNAITEALSLKDIARIESKENTRKIFKNGRVLVAEDNSINQMIIVTTLKQLGLSSHVVSNGSEAIDAYTEGKFDLVLMDCQMPEVDGYQATEKIRSLEKHSGHKIPIVALTANAFKEDRDRCLASGMDDFLSKPVRKDKLVETLKKYLISNVA